MDKSVFAALEAFMLMLFPVLLAVFLYAYMARRKALWRKAIGRNKSKTHKILPHEQRTNRSA